MWKDSQNICDELISTVVCHDNLIFFTANIGNFKFLISDYSSWAPLSPWNTFFQIEGYIFPVLYQPKARHNLSWEGNLQ